MLVSAVWLWPALLNVVNRVLQVRLQGWDPASPSELLFTAFDWLLYALVTPAIFWISKRWPIVKPQVRQRLVVHAAWALCFCVVWAVSGKLLELALAAIFSPDKIAAAMRAADASLIERVAKNVASWVLTTLPFGAVVYATVAGMAHAISYFTEARERELQLAKLSEQLTGARYAALQAQLNPHFLFNTLNTIAVLVRDGDRSGAVHIVEQLSEVLRRTLNRHRENEVALDEEMSLVRTYLSIEQARFSDRLRVIIETNDVSGNAAVPGFALQHLVENAIRHGIARRAEAGVIRIKVKRSSESLVLQVEDDGPGVAGSLARAGHGLENTRERLHALYGNRATLELQNAPSGGAIAILQLPYREISSDGARVDE